MDDRRKTELIAVCQAVAQYYRTGQHPEVSQHVTHSVSFLASSSSYFHLTHIHHHHANSLPSSSLVQTRSEDHGKPKQYDPQFNGPIKNRGCTDILCCILFLLCIGGLGFVGYLGYFNGDPTMLLHPTDSLGNVCGRDADVIDKPYLFYFDYLACANLETLVEFSCGTPQICVSSCPNITYAPYALVSVLGIGAAAVLDWSALVCEYGFDPQAEFLTGDYQGAYGLTQIFEQEKCAAYTLPESVYTQRCVPTVLVEAVTNVDGLFTDSTSYILTSDGTNQGNATVLATTLSSVLTIYLQLQGVFEVLYEDAVASWHIILIGISMGMVLCMIFIVLMRWFAGIIVYLTILLLYSLLGVGTFYCFWYWKQLEGVQGSDDALTFSANLLSYLRLRITWLIFGCVLGGILLILLLITLCLCNRIRIAIALIKESSWAVGSMFSTLFWPVIPFILEILVVCLWLSIALFVSTSYYNRFTVVDAPSDFALQNGTECFNYSFNNTYPNTTARCQFAEYTLPWYTVYLQFYAVFMLFWLVNFVIALGQMTLAGAFASYYWAFTKPQDIPAFPVFQSLWRSIRYHLGSLAFGSLIIAIIQLIRVILEYVEKKLKGNMDNKVVQYIIKCFKCLFWILEKVMKFINKNAYIIIAIYGNNFCSASQEAFWLLLRNILRVTVVNKLTDFIILLGKLCVTALIGVASFFYFTDQIVFLSFLTIPDVTYYWTPIIIICIGTYAIAWCFFSVYDMAVDTLFLCFLEDLERHDGSAEKPYYMSKELRQLVGKKNKADEVEDSSDDEF